MQSGAQRQAAEADGWRVWATEMWTTLCTTRGCGEQMYRYVLRQRTDDAEGVV